MRRLAASVGGVLGGSVLLVMVVRLPWVAGAMRTVLATGLVGACPGWAILRHVAFDDALERVVLAVALSLALATAVVALLMYTGWWSPARTVAILAMLTLAAGSLERRADAAPGERGSQ
jgi:uncharacterized membrane protein